jgi:hypothetical protein
MKHLYAIVFLLSMGLLASSCGGGGGATGPNPGPSATPTPTPTPTATPNAEIACNPPIPPPLYGWRIKVQIDNGFRKILDSRALVGRDAAYCGALGLGGDICVVRNEEDPQAVTCSNRVVGKAADTGRYGPTWSYIPPGGFTPQPCKAINAPGQDPGCKNHDTNQYFVIAYGPGTFAACGENGVCHGFEI